MMNLRLWTNGQFTTFDPRNPEAECLVSAGSQIVAVGDRTLGESWRSQVDEVIDLGGGWVIPGLTDSHIHFIEHGLVMQQAALEECRSPAEVVEAIRAFPHDPSGWIVGAGFQVNLWEEGQRPHRAMLDQHFPERPVVLFSRCGHQIWVNTPALAAAGVGRDTASPSGGVIVRGEGGEATGVLQEEAIELILRVLPKPSEDQLRHAVQMATEDLWRLGIVAVHAPEGREYLSLMSRMRQDAVLRMRTHYLPPISMAEELVRAGQCSGLGDRWLRMGGLKIFLDGALGSSTGLMHEAHVGQPENFGVEVTPPDVFCEMVEHAHANRWRVAVHAIGDKAVDRAIDTIAASQARHGIRRDDPGIWDRIEHFECLSPGAAERAGRARIAAMMQPVHIFDDWRPADRLWGERAQRAYACRSSIDAGVPVALGSDSPVASANPWLCIHAAVKRTDLEGLPEGGWYRDEAMSIDQALRGFCLVPALVADEITWRGRLSPGCVADFVIVDQDPWSPETDHCTVQTVMTVVDGCAVFDRSGTRDEGGAVGTGL